MNPSTFVQYFIAVTLDMDVIHGTGYTPADAIEDAVEKTGDAPADFFSLECTSDLFAAVNRAGGDVVKWTDDSHPVCDVILNDEQRAVIERVIPEVQAFVIETVGDAVPYNYIRRHGKIGASRAMDESVDDGDLHEDLVVRGIVESRISDWMHSTQD